MPTNCMVSKVQRTQHSTSVAALHVYTLQAHAATDVQRCLGNERDHHDVLCPLFLHLAYTSILLLLLHAL